MKFVNIYDLIDQAYESAEELHLGKFFEDNAKEIIKTLEEFLEESE